MYKMKNKFSPIVLLFSLIVLIVIFIVLVIILKNIIKQQSHPTSTSTHSFSVTVIKTPESLKKTEIYVDGTNLKLYLVENSKIKNVYPINIGAGGLYKTMEGDRKTPIGEYQIAWMVSRHGNKGERVVDGRTWCKNNKLYFGDTGPLGEKLWTIAYGGSEATVMGLDYPNAQDIKNDYTGGCIEIHASRHNKPEPLQPSDGCIKMYPDDALFLYNKVNLYTKLHIVERLNFDDR